jgi:hypothetical protein
MEKISRKHIVLLILVSILLVLLIPIAHAAIMGPGEVLLQAVEWIVIVFGFEWLTKMGDTAVLAFVRFLIFVFIANVLHLVITTGGAGRVDRKTSIVSSIVLSLMASVGIPNLMIKSIITIYSSIAMVFLLGLVVYFFYWVHQRFPGTSIAERFIKIAIYVASFVLLNYIGYNILFI